VNGIADAETLFAKRPILGVPIAVVSCDEAIRLCSAWARHRNSRAVFFASVHMVMEAHDHPDFLRLLNNADMVNADGMPVVWALRAVGEKMARRVCGPDTTTAMLAKAEKEKIPVGFYGGDQATLDALAATVHERHPRLKIVFLESPPFRALTPGEDAAAVDRIAASGAQLLFVGLGCPKQENWIMEHRGRVPCVMLGVGAAFDFIGGIKPRAPRWMMRCGLEWAFRLASEPKRLAWRYLKHNPRFVFLFLRQLLAARN
jgi:N-acetylglucosaminyldiphosphoundecaprenol N-acetyl-beta-D-mannosaminyltransferase